jgi:O-acetyl-ADP-ribose deacetylase (regulator of RNase III)
VSFHFVRTRVEIALASAPWPEADALILPTNDYLWMATGPALETKMLAGEEAELAAVRLGPIPPGQVMIAPAGSLPLAAIIHTAVMGQDLHVDGPLAAQALAHAVKTAGDRKWSRLLIHSILATGRGTRPEVLRGALSNIVDIFLDETPVRSVTFLVENEAERSVLHEAMLRIVQGHP